MLMIALVVISIAEASAQKKPIGGADMGTVALKYVTFDSLMLGAC
jgi:hypothetical protein